MFDQQFLDVRPLKEATGPVTLLERAVEVAPGGITDLVDALRQGEPLYESGDSYLISLRGLLNARMLRQLDEEAAKEPEAA